MENDKFQTISQRRYAEAAAELDAAELQLADSSRARQQADAPRRQSRTPTSWKGGDSKTPWTIRASRRRLGDRAL
ncbi:MAG: hypothetical protein ACLT9P_03355 [Evtepia gabavorous]